MYNEYLSKFINWRQGGDKPKSVTQVFLLYKSLGAFLKLVPIPIYQCSMNYKTFFSAFYVFNICIPMYKKLIIKYGEIIRKVLNY